MMELFDNEENSPEISSYVRKLSVQYEPPEKLVRLVATLAEDARVERRAQSRRTWRVALASALVATLTFGLGMKGLEFLLDSKDPYDIVVEEAKLTYRRVLPEHGKGEPAAKVPLKELVTLFKNHLRYEPKLSLAGPGKFVLERGDLSEVFGTEVGHLIYRANDTHILLMIARADDAPDWPLVLQDDWVTINENHPKTFVWRRGDFIYALAGQISLDQFHRLSSSIGVPNGSLSISPTSRNH